MNLYSISAFLIGIEQTSQAPFHESTPFSFYSLTDKCGAHSYPLQLEHCQIKIVYFYKNITIVILIKKLLSKYKLEILLVIIMYSNMSAQLIQDS